MDFQTTYKQFYPKISRYLTRILDDQDLAEDFTQDVFIRVYEGWHTFEGRSKISTWIYKIATNLAYDYFKSTSFQKGKKRRVNNDFIEKDSEDKNVWMGDKSEISDQILEEKEMSSCIRRYVQDISENYRTIFILSEYEGLKNKEIAEILGLTNDTVKIRIYRARTQLKKMMDKGCIISYEESGIKCDEK
jgi:RNA polymerase sigma-70 factor (ECF subfamily)